MSEAALNAGFLLAQTVVPDQKVEFWNDVSACR